MRKKSSCKKGQQPTHGSCNDDFTPPLPTLRRLKPYPPQSRDQNQTFEGVHVGNGLHCMIAEHTRIESAKKRLDARIEAVHFSRRK
jgi:hypothetical protein